MLFAVFTSSMSLSIYSFKECMSLFSNFIKICTKTYAWSGERDFKRRETYDTF